jgi:DNA-binding NarL/FixJ family response regulator
VTTPIRVLIVDDDVPTRVGLRAILSSAADVVPVGEAATGREALDQVDSLLPDVVLMDVRLPDVDGISVTERIVGRAGQVGPRVIILTTFEFDEYVFRSLQAGASGFLLKRARAEELIDAIRTVAAGDALPAPSSTRTLINSFVSGPPDRASEPLIRSLTAREMEVLGLIARGLSNAEIAEALGVSIETVRTHVKRVYLKCNLRDRTHAVILAYESGLVPRGTN